ncbi:filaggrin-2 isoform X2 [Dunckerocampus dactyliophorus]|uniref:filaggrin-2 isoform X2 n=1 Tax=Dunckerocampus dactyliophorus TaxID=161453 RepID=UPI0024069513|nr:filaggrin-2 isoform X2 [Dunckerocampus dactyliophorus]
MCDHQEKSKSRKPDAKVHIMKQRRSTQKKLQLSEEDDTLDTHSTAEDSLLSDHHPDHQRRSDLYHRKQTHGRLSLSETSLTSSFGSSSFSSSTSASSSSSSSHSSPTSESSSSVSSESSVCSDGFLLRRPQHSLSCTDISRKHKYAEYVEETTPLIGNRDHLPEQKQGAQKKTQKTARGSANDGSFRKSKSMEALTCSTERGATEVEKEQEKRKKQVRQNLMKEKMKFSAFLNEITRQVLSPMRLTTLGVRDVQRQSSMGSASVRSRKLESNRQPKSRPVSADPVSSSKCSHTRLSKSSHRRRRQCSPDATEPMQPRPRSCTDISCLERHPSRSSQHCPNSPSFKRRHHRYQGSHVRHCHHHRGNCNTPSCHHRSISPHRKHRYYSPVFSDHGDHDETPYRHHKDPHRHHHEDNHDGDRYSPDDHHHRRDYHDQHFHYHHGCHHGPRHGDHHFTAHYLKEHNDRTYHPPEIHSSSSQDHEHHQSPSHHHCNHLNRKHPVTPRRGNQGQSYDYRDHPYPKHHHRGDHHGLPRYHNSEEQHHRGVPHGDPQQVKQSEICGGQHPHQRDQPNHRDRHSSGHQHHHGNHHSPNHQHHHGDDLSEAQQPDDDDDLCHKHRHGDQHHHGNKHGPNHQQHRGTHGNDLHQHSHGERQSSGHQHHQRDHHRPNSQHHNRDHRQHHHGDHQNQNSHHYEDHHSRVHQNHHGDQRHLLESHQNQAHTKNNDSEHKDPHTLDSLPPHQKNPTTSSLCGQEEEQTDFSGPSLPQSIQEATHEMDNLMVLQKDNEGLHQSVLKSAVRMECLGEFLSSQKLLEEELQRTRAELSNLTENFKILHENCSSTQQTNNLLEQKLNSVVKSVLNKSNNHFHPDDAIDQGALPITPPPIQFMDSQNYEKVKAAGQEQSLGSVPEEDESDWSEMGEEIPRFILMGSNRGQAWRHRDADVDKDSESGGEEMVRRHSPRPLQIPHLQFTIHNEILPLTQPNACPSGMAGESTFRITTSQNLGSTILIRSASLEEIPLACHQTPKELRGTEAMMDLHHPRDDSIQDLDNEIIHHWRSSNERGRERPLEADSAPSGLQSVEQMLNQFMCEPQPGEGRRQGRPEVHGWTGGMAEEVFGGEQTQL